MSKFIEDLRYEICDVSVGLMYHYHIVQRGKNRPSIWIVISG